MQQKVSPLAAVIIVIVVLAVIGGIFALRGRQDTSKVQETAKRGETVGQKMMQAMQNHSVKTSP